MSASASRSVFGRWADEALASPPPWGFESRPQGRLFCYAAEPRSEPQAQSRRRPKRLLSGLLRCGQCGGPVTVVTGARSPRLGCTTARDKGTCTQHASVRLDLIERRVLDGLRTHLLAPELVAEAVRAYHDEMRQHQAQTQRRRGDLQRDLAEAQRKARRLAEKLLDSDGPQPTLQSMLREAEARIGLLAAILAMSANEKAPTKSKGVEQCFAWTIRTALANRSSTSSIEL